MTYRVEPVSNLSLKRSSRADYPCEDREQTGPAKPKIQLRRHHLILMAINTVAILLLLGNTFLSDYFSANTLTGSPIVIAPAEGSGTIGSSQTLTLAAEEEALTSLYEVAGPAVVKVVVAQRGKVQVTETDARGDGVGSGIVLDKAGHIVTNNHVVAEANDVVVQLADGQTALAKVIGQDPATDLAVLEIDVPAGKMTPASFANSDELRVGQIAVVIGHPFGLDKSLTVGHISGLGRMTPSADKFTPIIENMIQTDAVINPGNSGGPLFNLSGEVVGINTSIFSTSRGWQGVGFAVSSNAARAVIADLLEKGYVSRPFLGVAGLPLNAQQAKRLDLEIKQGLLIQEVSQGSAAWEAGLRAGDDWTRVGRRLVRVGGDVLIAIDGQPVDSMTAVSDLLRVRTIGDTVALIVHRDGEEIELEATLTERPAPEAIGDGGT